MGYYMRFIVADDKGITISLVARALQEADPAYSIANATGPPSESGDLMYSEDTCAQLEINRAGEESFEEEVPELIEFVEDAEGAKREAVLQVLQSARAVLAIQVLHRGRETETTLRRVDPLCDWLLASRGGLLQVDGEGYYDASGLILRVE
ncbi:MAG: hypothetical protein ACYTFI_12190 [Planctomycetota bacterium]|jgi:hypothetical protein